MAAEEKEEKREMLEVIVRIKGGWVNSITHPANVRVITKDYDVDEDFMEDENPDVKHDEDGAYTETVWEL